MEEDEKHNESNFFFCQTARGLRISLASFKPEKIITFLCFKLTPTLNMCTDRLLAVLESYDSQEINITL